MFFGGYERWMLRKLDATLLDASILTLCYAPSPPLLSPGGSAGGTRLSSLQIPPRCRRARATLPEPPPGPPRAQPRASPGAAGREPATDPESVSLAFLPTTNPSDSSWRKSGRANRSPPTFETLLDSVGGFGRYQLALCVGLIGSSTFVCALTYYTQVLVLLAPPLRCADAVGGHLPEGGACGGRGDPPRGDGSVTACTNWTYDTEQFFATITSEVSAAAEIKMALF